MTGERRRVGVNLLWLVPGEVGGSEEYTVGLLGALADAEFDDLEVILYVNRRFAEVHCDLCARFTTVVAPISGTSRPLRVLAESTWLARRTRRDRVAAVHHAGGTMPILRTVPGLVTLHDLQPITDPAQFGPIKRRYIAAVAPRSLRAARRVVCLSAFVAGDAVAVAGVDPTRIALVPSGVDPAVRVPAPEQQQAALAALGLVDRRFILFPAITYPHKNHRTLVAAFARLLGTDRRDQPMLVLTGGVGPAEEALAAEIARLGLGDSVRRPGRVPAEVLDILYRHATVMAFPSTYEGFGLPLLEAMVRGCPVVASAVGGLVEVGGDAVDALDPLDVAGWAAALGRMLDDEDHRTGAIRRGLEQSGRFRWSGSAAALAATYRSVIAPSAS